MDKRAEESIPTSEFEELVQRNVEAVARIEQASHAKRTRADVISDLIAGFCGRPLFVYVHCAWFLSWLLWNTSGAIPKAYHFDPPPYNMLTLVVSLEAIFLSSFILISQNRQQRIADQRNHLDLQINLLAEQESSQMLAMMKQLLDHHGIPVKGSSLALLAPTDPEQIAEQLEVVLSNPEGEAVSEEGGEAEDS